MQVPSNFNATTISIAMTCGALCSVRDAGASRSTPLTRTHDVAPLRRHLRLGTASMLRSGDGRLLAALPVESNQWRWAPSELTTTHCPLIRCPIAMNPGGGEGWVRQVGAANCGLPEFAARSTSTGGNRCLLARHHHEPQPTQWVRCPSGCGACTHAKRPQPKNGTAVEAWTPSILLL